MSCEICGDTDHTAAQCPHQTPFDELWCSKHECQTVLVDYEDGSRYECPACRRENGEALGLR